MNLSRHALLLAGVSALVVAPAGGASKPVRRAAPRKPSATAPVAPPPASTLNASGQMTPSEVLLRAPTAAESEANSLWSLRAALNVAAYQCGYSPFLDSVGVYNAVLKQHSEQLDSARRTLVAHFKRYNKTGGDADFDRYSTRVYNSFSTLDAQYSFCEQAALVGRNVLAVPKGALGLVAKGQSAAIRAALEPSSPLGFLGSVSVDPVSPVLDDQP